MNKCEICSAPATVYLTQIINGKSSKYYLCNKCAQEKGLLDPSAFDLAEKIFPSLQQSMESQDTTQVSHQAPPVQSLPLTTCPVCSFTLEKYKNVGRLGCSECYRVFAEEILPIVEQIQPAAEHHGKKPVHADIRETQQKSIQQLEQELKVAISAENYSKAAQLRDLIKSLKESSQT